ncbi:MAG: uroporphyrin-3 C-methyltransferase [Psychromonas sp.]|jgi:uroporphyrin-3 C-methyltransferase|uniref:uroporphyrinogen-III C-methyltransferase n=1 Tax=Psychromonas sp. TaxID=1884585 RepID=UPI0039E62216
MTDKNNEIKKEEPTLTSETSVPAAEIPALKKPGKSSKLVIYLALFSFVLLLAAIALGGYLYKENKTVNSQQQLEISQLSGQLAAQSKAASTQVEQALRLQSDFKTQMEQVNIQLQQVKNENKLYKTDVQALQRSLAQTRVRHPNDWMLAEVEYLVTLAGRKIWLERDIPTAIALLLAADQRVVELSDSSLSPLRAMLLEDINLLEALPKRDPDGLVLALSNLERGIDKLLIAGLKTTDGADKIKADISTDINDWQENLVNSWSDFVAGFIVINKRDAKLQAQISPQESWYLKEKLRNDLAKAEFSVYREQQEIYDIALHSAAQLVKNYYDLNDNTTSHFYQSIQRLSKRKISINYPDQLKSAPLLDRIINQRVKKSLASARVDG